MLRYILTSISLLIHAYLSQNKLEGYKTLRMKSFNLIIQSKNFFKNGWNKNFEILH